MVGKRRSGKYWVYYLSIDILEFVYNSDNNNDNDDGDSDDNESRKQ